MLCSKVEAQLLDYIKEETELYADITAHLEQCQKCREKKQEIIIHLDMYQKMKSFESLTRKWESLSNNILFPPKELPIYSNRLPSVYFGAFACAALVIFFGIIYSLTQYSHWEINILQGRFHIDDPEVAGDSHLLLKKGSKISTPRGQSTKYIVNKTAIVTMGAETEVELDVIPRIILHKGEIFIQSRGEGKLVIQTQDGEIYMKGTAFSVRRDSITNLHVYRGKVYFRNAHDSIHVQEGQSLISDRSKPLQLFSKKTASDYPWWVDAPLSFTLDVISTQNSRTLLYLNLRNNSNGTITISPLSGGTPRFSIHIKTEDKNYTIPLRSVLIWPKQTPIKISPLGICILHCDVSKEIHNRGRHSFVVVYNSDGENGWKGIVATPPLHIDFK